MSTDPSMFLMPTGGELVRLVVQSVSTKGSVSPVYRVIVYPEQKGFRNPAIFASREKLLRHLADAVPGFDATQLRDHAGASRILFAETVRLTQAQIAKLFGI